MSDFAALRHNDWKVYLGSIPKIEESAHLLRARWRAKQTLREIAEKKQKTNMRDIRGRR